MIRSGLAILIVTGFILKLLIIGILAWLIWGEHHIDFVLPFGVSSPLSIRYSGCLNFRQGNYYLDGLRIGSKGNALIEINDCRLFYTADSCWIHIREAKTDYRLTKDWVEQNVQSGISQTKPGSEFHFSHLICRRILIDNLELTGLTPQPIHLELAVTIDQEKNGMEGKLRWLDPGWDSPGKGFWEFQGWIKAACDSGWDYRIQAHDSLNHRVVWLAGNLQSSPLRMTYKAKVRGQCLGDRLSLPNSVQAFRGLDLDDLDLELDGDIDPSRIDIHHLKSRLSGIMGSTLTLEAENSHFEIPNKNLSWENLTIEWNGVTIHGDGCINLSNRKMDGDYQVEWIRLPVEIPDLMLAGRGHLEYSQLDLSVPRAHWIDFSLDGKGFYRDYPVKLGGKAQVRLNYPWISLVYGKGRINSLDWSTRGWGRLDGTEFRLQADLVGRSVLENPGELVIRSDSLIAHLGLVRARSGPPVARIELNTPRLSVDEIQIQNLRAVSRNWNVMDLRSGEFELSMDQIKVQDVTLLSSLSMKTMVISDRQLDFHPIVIHLPGDNRLDLNGRLDLNHKPWSLTLENSRLEIDRHSYPLTCSYPIRVDSQQRINVDSLVMMIGQNALYFTGWYNLKKKNGVLRLNCPQLDIAELKPVIPAKGMALMKTGRLALAGMVELDSGTIRRGDLQASGQKLQWDEVSIDKIDLKADWSEGRIMINDLRIGDYNHQLQFSGTLDSIPSVWVLTGTLNGEGEIPFYLSRYLPDVYLLTGRYRIKAGCDGPIRDLNWHGSLIIDSTELFLDFLETPIRNIRIDSHFNRDTLWADSFSGWTVSNTQHKKSFWSFLFHPQKPAHPALAGTGWWSFQDETYRLTVTGKDAEIEYLPVKLDLLADCQLDISNQAGKHRVDGNIQLNRFNLRDDFSNYVSRSDTNALLYHIILTMPKNIWIKNKYITMETGGMLELSLEPNMDLPEVYGDLNVKRGQVFFYGYSFKIESGKLNFISAAELNPEFDIVASTRIQDLRIQLNLTGTLKKPEFTLSSSPVSLSQEELMMIFFSSQRSGASQSGIEAGTERVLTGLVSQRISQSGIRYLGVDHFNLDPNESENSYSGFNSMLDRLRFSSLTIGKYLTPNIFLTYSGQLTLSGDKSISVEYLLNRNVSIVGEKKTDGRYRMGIRMKYSY